jgi:hypothetical protein
MATSADERSYTIAFDGLKLVSGNADQVHTPLADRFAWGKAPRRTRFDHRTKAEQPATILLPNPVAAHDRERDVMDGHAKIFKENNTAQNRPSPAGMAVTEFRVRCFQPTAASVAHRAAFALSCLSAIEPLHRNPVPRGVRAKRLRRSGAAVASGCTIKLYHRIKY